MHAFAKQVGELHSLSRVDLSLLALAYTLEAATRGTQHLSSSPAPPRAAKASKKAGPGRIPGWGDRGSTWDELDAIDDPDAPGEGRAPHPWGWPVRGHTCGATAAAQNESPALPAGAHADSRIADGVRSLDLDDSQSTAAEEGGLHVGLAQAPAAARPAAPVWQQYPSELLPSALAARGTPAQPDLVPVHR